MIIMDMRMVILMMMLMTSQLSFPSFVELSLQPCKEVLGSLNQVIPAGGWRHWKYKYNTQIHKYTNTQIHKYTNTQLHKCTNTQMHKYTNAQIYKYTNTQIQIQINFSAM